VYRGGKHADHGGDIDNGAGLPSRHPRSNLAADDERAAQIDGNLWPQSDIARRDGGCILPSMPAALTSLMIGLCRLSIFSQARATVASSQTSTCSGNIAIPGEGTRSLAAATVAAPMPLRPPVTATMPAAFVSVIVLSAFDSAFSGRARTTWTADCVVVRASRKPAYFPDFANFALGWRPVNRNLVSFDNRSRARFVSRRRASTNSSAAGESGNCAK